jgi:hypothetical protein
MAFSLQDFDKLSQEGLPSVPKIWGYSSSADALATIIASAYFNTVSDKLTIGDKILIVGSDGNDDVRVTAVSPNVTVV